MISETASFAASGAAPAFVADSMQLCRQLVQQLFALSLCAVMPFCFCFAFAFVLFVTGLSRLAATHHWLLFMQGGVWRLRCARLLVLLACQEVMVEESQEVSPQRAIPTVVLGMERIMLMLPSTHQSRESFTEQVHGAVAMLCTRYAEQADYVLYFQKQWGQKTGQCVSAHASWHCLHCSPFVTLLAILQLHGLWSALN